MELKYMHHCNNNEPSSKESTSIGQRPSQWMDTTPAIVNNLGLRDFHIILGEMDCQFLDSIKSVALT